MPGVPGYLWLLPLCFLPLHRGLRVQRAPGVPCALSGAKEFCTARARCAASAKLFVDLTSLRAKRSDPDSVIPGRCEASNPESRDSGPGPSDHPGMTASGFTRSLKIESRTCDGGGALSPPLRGRVGEGGSHGRQPCGYPPSLALPRKSPARREGTGWRCGSGRENFALTRSKE